MTDMFYLLLSTLEVTKKLKELKTRVRDCSGNPFVRHEQKIGTESPARCLFAGNAQTIKKEEILALRLHSG
jgi:hypothetical protein